jgi:uncharacterized membrane protein YedE/YeeE
MKNLLAALISGWILAVGLGLSGMTQPEKVIGFLDPFGGHWDPSLALVMVGAIALHLPAIQWLRRVRPAPPLRTEVASTEDGLGIGAGVSSRGAGVDLRLIAGACVFGIGWGLAGYCPGPALVTLVTFSPGILVFVASMMTGMWLFHLLLGRVPSPPKAPSTNEPSRPQRTVGAS